MVDENDFYKKFEVRRTDGEDLPGKKHENCIYFVIDIVHDKYADCAILAYAIACAADNPELSDNLTQLVQVLRQGKQA